MTDSLDLTFGGRLRIPLIQAPMFLVSCPALALAACSRGVMGSFPAHSTRTPELFGEWLVEMEEGMARMESAGEQPAPFAINLVVHRTNARYEGDLELCRKHRVPVVLTSKGAPQEAFDEIHAWGGVAFHDVASRRHAEKAIEAGADGLIAVCGGAGGHTGQVNPFALVNEIREITDKPIVLSGALSTGRDVLTAQVMGADMAYMGTRFIACPESLAPDDYRNSLVAASAKDVFYTEALDGMPTNFLAPSMLAQGIDLDELKYTKPGEKIDAHAVKARYKGIWSAGHGVGAVRATQPAAEVCDELVAQYEAARRAVTGVLGVA